MDRRSALAVYYAVAVFGGIAGGLAPVLVADRTEKMIVAGVVVVVAGLVAAIMRRVVLFAGRDPGIDILNAETRRLALIWGALALVIFLPLYLFIGSRH